MSFPGKQTFTVHNHVQSDIISFNRVALQENIKRLVTDISLKVFIKSKQVPVIMFSALASPGSTVNTTQIGGDVNWR